MAQKADYGRIESIQAVRALAFLSVFTFHSGLSQIGCWGVSVFLVLSGFLLAYNNWDRPLKTDFRSRVEFSIRKIWKLYPLHILTTWLMLVLLEQPYETGNDIASFLMNCLLLQAWIPDDKVYLALNGGAWYLSAMLFLYAVFPLVLKRMQRITSVRKALLVAIGVWLLQWAAGFFLVWYYRKGFLFEIDYRWITDIFPVSRLGELVIGACLAYIYAHGSITLSKGTATLLELLTVLCVFVCGWFYRDAGHILGYEAFRYKVLFVLPAGAAVMLFALKQGMVSNLLTCRPMVYLGNLSAFAYLIHSPLMWFLRYHGKLLWQITVTPMQLTVICLPMTILLSALWKELSRRAFDN